MPQLQYLEAAACHITALPSGWSLNVPVLEILNLNYNYLEHVNGLEGMLSLRKVSIVGNRLGGGQELPLKGLRRLSNLQEVDLRYVPFARFWGCFLTRQDEPVDARILPASDAAP